MCYTNASASAHTHTCTPCRHPLLESRHSLSVAVESADWKLGEWSRSRNTDGGDVWCLRKTRFAPRKHFAVKTIGTWEIASNQGFFLRQKVLAFFRWVFVFVCVSEDSALQQLSTGGRWLSLFVQVIIFRAATINGFLIDWSIDCFLQSE